jgi:hypothetical protein
MMYSPKTINSLFEVKSGDFHKIAELDPGEIPLISCGDSANGLVGFYDIPPECTYHRAVTVAYNGSWPLLAKFHPYTFGAKDDVAVLTPRNPMLESTLLYIVALLNSNTWRYSYGRKCFKGKLLDFEIAMPIDLFGEVDEAHIAEMVNVDLGTFLPAQTANGIGCIPDLDWKNFSILDIFDLDRGDFHSIRDLDSGSVMTISRVSTDNGVVGYFDPPPGAQLYPARTVTVSTVGGDAFVQLNEFIATDNVVVCSPKRDLHLATLFFICSILNYQKWRYTYGRQCYKTKYSKTILPLPVTSNGEIDEESIQDIIEQSPYWEFVRAKLVDTS